MVRFDYGGSSLVGTILLISGIFYIDNGDRNYSVRIYDKTNREVIATLTDQTNEDSQTIDLGEVSNVPEELATLELQMKVSNSNVKAYCESLTLTLKG